MANEYINMYRLHTEYVRILGRRAKEGALVRICSPLYVLPLQVPDIFSCFLHHPLATLSDAVHLTALGSFRKPIRVVEVSFTFSQSLDLPNQCDSTLSHLPPGL